MADSSLLDDVKALLDHGFEDDRILKQIYRACQRDEVVSNYERNYVEKLAELHLRKSPQFNPSSEPIDNITSPPLPPSPPPVPDVVLPQTRNTLQIQPLQTTSTSFFGSKKNKKIALVIGIIALLAISAAGTISLNMPDKPFTGVSDNNVIDRVLVADTLSVQTDLSSYAHKDLVSISGTSDVAGLVNLTIENANYEVVWQEQLSLRNNGQFSTLVIAGGSGWENSGIYTLTVKNDAGSTFVTFSFTV